MCAGCDSSVTTRTSPGLKSAALLHRLEQLLVVEVAVAEVPAVDDAGDQLALAHVVVLDVVDGAVDQAVERPAVRVHRAEAEARGEHQLGQVASS